MAKKWELKTDDDIQRFVTFGDVVDYINKDLGFALSYQTVRRALKVPRKEFTIRKFDADEDRAEAKRERLRKNSRAHRARQLEKDADGFRKQKNEYMKNWYKENRERVKKYKKTGTKEDILLARSKAKMGPLIGKFGKDMTPEEKERVKDELKEWLTLTFE